MKDATAKKILKSVSDSYNAIADEFSDTRQAAWDDFQFFQPYLFENAEIVDLGCGNGRLIKFLDQFFLGQQYRYIGVDNSTGLLKHAARQFPKKIFLPGDQLNIPIETGQVNVLFNIAAFHHIPSKSLRLAALAEMKRVLKPNGILILTVWNLWQWKYWWANLAGWLRSLFSLGNFAPNDLFIPWKSGSRKVMAKRYYHNFLPSELDMLVKKAGFTVLECFPVRKGKRTSLDKAFNYLVIARNHV